MLKVKINNNGKTTEKDFKNLTATVNDEVIASAAICLLMNSLADSIMSDLEDVVPFGDFVVIDKSTAEEVLKLNAAAKRSAVIMEDLVVTPYFVNSAIAAENDSTFVTSVNVLKAVTLHVEACKNAAYNHLNNIFHRGISVLYTNSDDDIILMPTAALQTVYGEFEEIFITDTETNEYIHISNYGDDSIIAASWLAKAAGFKVEEDYYENVHVYGSLKKAIAKALLINSETEFNLW